MRRWILRHPVWFVAILAAAVRVWMLFDLPLVITNDGVWYLMWGRDLSNGSWPAISAFRTPGYPVFLGAVFEVFGVGARGVLAAQHGLGVATAAMVAWAVKRRHGPRWAIAAGLIAGLSPAIWVWESYALTETLTVFATVSACSLVLVPRGGPGRGLAVGVLLGVMCLTRPAAQVMVPFVVVGWMLKKARQRKSLGIAAVLLGLAATAGPWVAYNAQRGVNGMGSGGGVVFWMGMAISNALDETYPLPPDVAAAYTKLKSGPVNDIRVGDFIEESRAWSRPEVQRTLSSWARASVFSKPGAYLRGVRRTLKAQLELRSPMNTDCGWFLWRLSRDGGEMGQAAPNYQLTGDGKGLEEFQMEPASGITRRMVGALAANRVPGDPQMWLLIAAGTAGMAFVIKRDWARATVVLGTGALFAVHVAMLLPFGRYGVPAAACWILVLPDAAKAIARIVRRIRDKWITRQAAPAAAPAPAEPR